MNRLKFPYLLVSHILTNDINIQHVKKIRWHEKSYQWYKVYNSWDNTAHSCSPFTRDQNIVLEGARSHKSLFVERLSREIQMQEQTIYWLKSFTLSKL